MNCISLFILIVDVLFEGKYSRLENSFGIAMDERACSYQHDEAGGKRGSDTT